MKFAIVLVALFAVALATPTQEVGIDGYNYPVEISDGMIHDEQGVLQIEGTEEKATAVRGSFSYTGDDGVTYAVNYIADENGFQPQGAHLPVAPEA